MMTWRYGRKWQLILFVGTSVLMSAMNVGVAASLTAMIQAATAKSATLLLQTLLPSLLAFSGATVATWATMLLQAAIIRQVNLTIKKVMTRQLIDHPDLSSSQGSDLSFMTNDLKMIETNGVTSELTVVGQLITFVGAMIGAFAFDWLTALIFFLGNLVPLVASKVAQGRLRTAASNWSEANGNWTSGLKNYLSGRDTISVYQAEGVVKGRIHQLADQLENSLRLLNILTSSMDSLGMLLALCFGVLLPFGVGIYRVISGASTLALFMGIVQLSNDMRNPLVVMIGAVNKWQTAQPLIAKVNAANHAPTVESSLLIRTGAMMLKHADVAIDGHKILNGLNLTITPGQKVLVMAPSGYGKSTLLRLLAGEMPVVAGQYWIGKTLVTAKNAHQLRQLFGLIKQTPFMFDDTIRFNLTLGERFSENALEQAAADAGLAPLIAEKGWDYQVGDEGHNLSGGQAQRLEIARALLRHRPILLADEATSALDEHLSDQLHAYFLKSPGTLIEVAHHISETWQKQYDQVIRLDELASQQ
ncbi:MAG: ABC transporter ATP-binding protein [Lacticaseibacillus paracasei]